MKIKSFIALCAFAAMSISVFAQKGELRTAKTSYDQYTALKSIQKSLAETNLQSAKQAIDKASLHEKTKNDPEVWTYRALIYADLAVSDSTFQQSEQLVSEAAEALKKAQELDKEGKNKSGIENAQKILAQYSMNKGVKEFQDKKYGEAYKAFEDVLTRLPGDTTVTYYAGLAAMMAQDYPAAIKKYSELLNTNYSKLEDIYLNLSISYAAANDTAAAIRTASEAAQKFPQNSVFATREIELSLMSGKENEVIEKIEAQAQKEPQNKIYPYYLGIAYNAVKNYDKAEEAYKKAIALDPNYTEANINLGGLIMNQGIELYNKANALPTSKQKEYEASMKQANALFDKAFPYLEKAVELDPKSRLALENLRTYYVVKNNVAKVTELKSRIDALQ